MVLVSPSMLSANFLCLEKEIKDLEAAGADLLHIDVMDGHFVPNLSFGPVIIKAIKKVTKLPLDVHLMITNAENYIDEYIDSGASYLTIHQEGVTHIHRTLSYIKNKNVKAGLALNPSTDHTVVNYILDVLDMVLVMSVNPGFSGQNFIPSMLDKVSALKNTFTNKSNCLIAIDGGINLQNAQKCVDAGVGMIVCGSHIFSNSNYQSVIKALQAL